MKVVRKKAQRGITMLEIAMALVVIAIIGSFIADMVATNIRATAARSTAEKMATISSAAERYMTTNQATLNAMTGGGVVIAIPVAKTCAACADPAAPGALDNIQVAGFLPSTFVDMNSSGQSHALLVRQDAGGNLEGLLTSYGGAAVDDKDIAQVTRILGAAGGGVYASAVFGAAGDIVGNQGGWASTTADWAAALPSGVNVTPAAGTVQVSMGLAALTAVGGGVDETQFLHRNVQGDPTLNQMNTDLDMTGNDLNNADVVRAGTELYSAGIVNAVGNIFSGGYGQATTWRAQSFIDTNDATYYLDPNGTSEMQNIHTRGAINSDGNINSLGWVLATDRVRGPRFEDTSNGYFINLDGTSNFTRIVADTDVVANYVETAGSMRAYGNIRTDGELTAISQVTTPMMEDADDASFFVNPNGDSRFLRIFTSSIVNTSDERLKEDIRDLDGREIVAKLSAKSYRWKDGRDGTSMGFIAQDVEEIFPDLVQTDPATGLKSVNYIELIAPMVDTIQDLDERLKALEEAH